MSRPKFLTVEFTIPYGEPGQPTEHEAIQIQEKLERAGRKLGIGTPFVEQEVEERRG